MDNNPILNVDPLGDFRTQFGAWIYSVFNGGGIINKNEFGEYYLSKTRFSKEIDGVFKVTVNIYYGECRNKYSSAGEDFEDLQSKDQLKEEWTRLGIWNPDSSPEDAGKNALNLGITTIIPSVYIRPTTNLFNIPKPQLTSGQMGKVIGWGEGQSSEAIQVTRELIDNLTKAQVKNWAKNGLTKSWLTDH